MEKERIEQILSDLKTQKLTTAKVEKALGFSNGLLGKAASGKTTLSKEKGEILERFWSNTYNQPMPEKSKNPVIEKIIEEVEGVTTADKVTIQDRLKEDNRTHKGYNPEGNNRTYNRFEIKIGKIQ